MPNNAAHILFAAGGTGGHLFPALSIADEIRKKDPAAKFVFAGSRDKIEARVVPQRGFEFDPIWISGFHRGLRPENLLFPFKVVVSLVQSFFLIRRFRPDVVVGTGGYVCGPVLTVASFMGVPTVVHESNSFPGVTTRMLSHRVTKVFTAFESTARWLKRTDNVELVGTPTRESLDVASRESAQKFFGLDSGRKTVLVFGGSLGATSVNRALSGTVDELVRTGIQFIWQTGERDYAEIRKQVEGKNIGWVGPFIDRMEFAYAAADLVVSRSGATTIAELTRVGKAAILVPYPYSAADHQTMNANSLAQSGAAMVLKDGDVKEHLGKTIQMVLGDRSVLDTMAKAAKALGKPGAGAVIAEKILALRSI